MLANPGPDMPQIDPLKIEQLVAGIAEHGFACVDDFLPAAHIAQLAAEAKTLQAAGAMHRATTGQQAALRKPDDNVRGDFIYWLEQTGASPAQQSYLQHLETLRTAINQSLYLGLFDLESHFAIYLPGAVYRRHLDQFSDNPLRQVSCILYLNQHWQPGNGGELRLYLNAEDETLYHDIAPGGGRLVAFLSGRFWHEVLPADIDRISLASWFRTRNALNGLI